MDEHWDAAGGGKQGFDWAARFILILRQHVVLITAVSRSEKSAASVFTALNDRGIGLSTVDLVRSHILQRAHESQRGQLLSHWNNIFKACGSDTGAETLMRVSWVAQKGDLKTKALYKVISDHLDQQDSSNGALIYSKRLSEDAASYHKFRDGDTDDSELEIYWLALKTLKFNSAYPLLLAAAHKIPVTDQKVLAKALTALVLRYSIVCNLDRAQLESVAFSCAKQLSDNGSLQSIIERLRGKSPNEILFAQNFKNLSFGTAEHGVARCLLELIEEATATTSELKISNSSRVHVEHIQPQTPLPGEQWPDQAIYVKRLGNLTLLDRRLNVSIKNSGFQIKKSAYGESRLQITKELANYTDWSPQQVEQRQTALLKVATDIWPEILVNI